VDEDEDGVENDEVHDGLAGLPQIVDDHESHESTHGVTSDNAWTVGHRMEVM